MYGTVFRYRVKAGMEKRFEEVTREFLSNPPEGFEGALTYRLDKGGSEYITAAAHKDKQSYQENAGSPRQDEWFKSLRETLESDPEWNDGEIIFGWDSK
jgi:hypothetical protein